MPQLYWSMRLFVDGFSAVDTSNKIRGFSPNIVADWAEDQQPNFEVGPACWWLAAKTLFCDILWSQFESSSSKHFINIRSEETRREIVKRLPSCTTGSCVWVWSVGRKSDLFMCCSTLSQTAVKGTGTRELATRSWGRNIKHITYKCCGTAYSSRWKAVKRGLPASSGRDLFSH